MNAYRKFLDNGIILLALLLIFGTHPSRAQLTIAWEQFTEGGIWDCIELDNGHYLLSHANSNYARIISELGPGGAFLQSTLTPAPASGQYLVRVNRGEITTRVGLVDDSSSFCLLSSSEGLEWQSEQVLGGTGSVYKYNQGGYISGGTFNFYPDPIKAFVRHYDDIGQLLWVVEYSSSNYSNTIETVCSDLAGTIYAPIAQSFPSGVLSIKKLDSEGNEIEVYNYQCYQLLISASSIDIQPDGNIFLSGNFPLELNSMYHAIIVSPDGELLNSISAPEIEDSNDHAIWRMPDGGYLAAATVDPPFPQPSKIVFTRYDAALNQLWQDEYFDGSLNYEDVSEYDLFIDSSGDIVVFGELHYQYDPNEFFIAKLTPDPTELEITIHPYGNVSAIPAPGRFYWHCVLTNNSDADITTDVWVIVRSPDGYPSQPLRIWSDITIPANSIYEADLRQNVPANAASGEYNYIVRAGEYYANDPQHTIQAYFPITVTGGTDVDRDPPRMHGIVAAPFDEPAQVEITPEFKTTK